METALISRATFVAHSFSSDIKDLTATIEAGIKHKGFSIINVYSPCVTYNKVNTYDWFRENLVRLSDIEGYDPTDRTLAMNTLMEHNSLVTGIIYQEEKPSYQEMVKGYAEKPLAESNMNLEPELFQELINEFM